MHVCVSGKIQMSDTLFFFGAEVGWEGPISLVPCAAGTLVMITVFFIETRGQFLFLKKKLAMATSNTIELLFQGYG